VVPDAAVAPVLTRHEASLLFATVNVFDQASSPLASSRDSKTLVPALRATFQVVEVTLWSPRSERTSPQGSDEGTTRRLYGPVDLSQVMCASWHWVKVGELMSKAKAPRMAAGAMRRTAAKNEANIVLLQ